MLSELHTAHKVIGVKQSKKAIRDGAAAQVFVALDAEKRVVGPIYELCSEHGMEVTEVTTMTELGDAVGIDVGASLFCTDFSLLNCAKRAFHKYL